MIVFPKHPILCHKCRSAISAFTTVELLLVIGIVVIMAATIVPVVNFMLSKNNIKVGINTIQVAVAANRPYAVRKKIALGDIDPAYPGAEYSGTAIIFTPAGELRLVENNQMAKLKGGTNIEPFGNAYSDIPGREYITMPSSVGVLGISRNSSGPLLLSLPFAIRFNENGHLVSTAKSWGYVLYSGKDKQEDDAQADDPLIYESTNLTCGGGLICRDKTFKGGEYDPGLWHPNAENYDGESPSKKEDEVGINPSSNKHKLSFEAFESVIGVLVYDREAFLKHGDLLKALGIPWDDMEAKFDNFESVLVPIGNKNLESNEGKWFQENGQAIFFNRYSGTILNKQDGTRDGEYAGRRRISE